MHKTLVISCFFLSDQYQEGNYGEYIKTMNSSIPIPTFDTVDNPNINKEDTIQIPIEKRALLQLDCAMQMHFHQTKTTKITYPAFCKLVSKVVLERSWSKSDDQLDNLLPTAIQTLSNEERLYHDVYCILVPQMYQESSDGSLQRNNINKQWSKQFRTLLDTASKNGVSKQRSDMVLGFFQSRTKHNKKNESTTTTTSTEQKSIAVVLSQNKENTSTTTSSSSLSSSPSSIIKPGMTLEERVRARAMQREQALQKMSQTKEKDQSMDLVKITDVLFSHARHMLRKTKNRQIHHKGGAKTFNVKKTSNTTKYAMTVPELVRLLPSDLSTTKQAIKFLLDVQAKCPGWVQWKNPSNFQPKPPNSSSSSSSSTISKRATVFLETSNYKHVRETLLGGKQQQQQSNNVTTKQVTPKERNSTFQNKNIVTLSRSKRGATMENARRKNNIHKRIRVNEII